MLKMHQMLCDVIWCEACMTLHNKVDQKCLRFYQTPRDGRLHSFLQSRKHALPYLDCIFVVVTV